MQSIIVMDTKLKDKYNKVQASNKLDLQKWKE